MLRIDCSSFLPNHPTLCFWQIQEIPGISWNISIDFTRAWQSPTFHQETSAPRASKPGDASVRCFATQPGDLKPATGDPSFYDHICIQTHINDVHKYLYIYVCEKEGPSKLKIVVDLRSGSTLIWISIPTNFATSDQELCEDISSCCDADCKRARHSSSAASCLGSRQLTGLDILKAAGIRG